MAKRGSDKKPLILRVQTEERAMEVSSICDQYGWKFIVGIEPDKPEDITDLDRLLNPVKSRIINLGSSPKKLVKKITYNGCFEKNFSIHPYIEIC